VLAVGCAIAASTPAQAGVQAFTGELALQIGGFDPIAVTGAGFASVEAGDGGPDHLAALSLEASPFAATGLLVPVTDPVAFPIAGVIATAHAGAGQFAGTSGALAGVMPVLGVAKVCLYAACGSSPIANLSVPITVVGQGGYSTDSGPVDVTVIGAPWTTGTAVVGSTTARGYARGPGGETSTTIAASGSVRLVTPIFISTNIGAVPVVPAFGFLTLHFVPEPGTLLLVGAGLAGLLGHGARRRHP
jgi:hypothetical protein